MTSTKDYVEIPSKAIPSDKYGVPLPLPMSSRQSFWESTFETTINIASGFIVSYLVWIFFVPILWPEHASSHAVAFGITVLFTVTSFLRSLIWRRFFNAELHKVVHKLVKSFYA